MEVERMRVHVGAQVLGVVNKKPDIGTLGLPEAGRVANDIFVALRRGGMDSIPIGSALIALMSSHSPDRESMPVLKLPEEYSTKRQVSRLIDFLVPSAEWKEAVPPKKWETVRQIEHFSITFMSHEGRQITTETIPGSCMFRLEALGMEIFANIIPVPSWLLSPASGKLRITELGMQDVSEVLARKIIRAGGNDMKDVQGIATLNNLPSLLVGKGHEILLGEVVRRTDENQEWLKQFKGKIMKVIAALSRAAHKEGKSEREHNIEFLLRIVSGKMKE